MAEGRPVDYLQEQPKSCSFWAPSLEWYLQRCLDASLSAVLVLCIVWSKCDKELLETWLAQTQI